MTKEPKDGEMTHIEFLRAQIGALVDAAIVRAACTHDNRVGGNDYILCHECGWQWDYRRSGPTEELRRYVRDELAAILS